MNSSPLFVQIAVSLDDRIEDSNKALDWWPEDRSVEQLHTETLESIAGMIFGRKAHEAIAQFWMDAAAGRMEMTEDLKRQSELMTALPKYVLTHGQDQTGWANSRVIRLDDVASIKAEAEKPIAAFAGAAAIQSLLTGGMVDEVRLIRYPVALGGGTPLFPNDGVRRGYTPIETKHFSSGATLERYR